MTPRHLAFAAALLAAGFNGAALAAGFTGPQAPANFTVANTGTLTGGSPVLGSAVFSTTQLTLTGSNSLSPPPGGDTPGCAGGSYSVLTSPCQLQATLAGAGLYSFHWSYSTADDSGPGGDIFGVLVDGQRTALSDIGGPIAQSGDKTFAAGASFGWFLNCTDCIGGAATATISSFTVSAVPEPASLTLALGGLAGLLGFRRRAGRSGVRGLRGA
jgi:hypothetical protein